jgi:Phosphatidylserine/phosphatidylglycerophosphate/cardiolipin synthases and related enzymes
MKNKYIANVQTDIYLGSGAGREIRKKIETARKGILVVSPFLSGTRPDQQGNTALCSLLVQKAETGVPVTLVTTEEAFRASIDNPIYALVNQMRVDDRRAIENKAKIQLRAKFWTVLNIVLAFFCGISFFAFDWLSLSITATGLVALSLFLNQIPYNKSKTIRTFYYVYRAKGNLNIKILKSFNSRQEKEKISTLHSKVYCIDSIVAYIGSMNYTESGFKYNFEGRAKIKDAAAVVEIENHWQQLFYDNSIPAIPLESLAKYYFEHAMPLQKLSRFRRH